MKGSIKKFFNGTINLLFPATCPVCSSLSDIYSVSPICSKCWGGIKRESGNLCTICSRPVSPVEVTFCPECYRERPFFAKAVVFGVYEGALREVIHFYKFNRIKRLAAPLSELLCSMDLPAADVIAPVPLSKKRLKERGFNQSLIPARKLSSKLNITLSENLLIKTRDTIPQSMMTKRDRLKSLKGAFRVSVALDNSKVILVDDVLTTGATLNHCSLALLEAGAKEVYGVVIARARI